jgi:hypothetical protein
MVTKSQPRKKSITIIQVGWVALFFAIFGGIYGFFAGGLANRVVGFIEFFIIGFILFYICASFIELFRK